MAVIQRRIQFIKGLEAELNAKIAKTQIIDNLTTGGSTDVLSAEQGKLLGTTKINYTDIVNDLTTGGVAVPLSAEQGKVLAGQIAGLSNALEFKGSFDASGALPTTISVGDFYKVSVAGLVGGVDLNVGDNIIAIVDKTSGVTINDFAVIDNTESADLLRDGDVSTDADFTVDGGKLTTRTAIKTLVDSATAAATINFINETVTLTGDTATLSHAPRNSIVFMGYASILNADDTVDLVSCTVSGTTLTIQPNTTGDYSGRPATVTYAY